MSYIAPRDFALDPELVQKLMRTFGGDLDLSWMKSIRERVAPEIVRHNFSMAPRGALLPDGLPSLGYRLNRKSEVWSDLAAAIFEEGKSRRWAPARDVPWPALDESGYTAEQEAAFRQIATTLVSIGLVAADVPARWEWTMNQEFHEVKYLMCLQMIDAARIAECFRKRALYGQGHLGTDFLELGELLKMVFESGTYPCASASLNLMLFSLVQALGRHWEWASRNAADTALGTRLAQDASRFVAYGIDHLRALLEARPGEATAIDGHLALMDNGLVGLLGSREFLEPLVVISGGFAPVASLYETLVDEYLARRRAAGLGDGTEHTPLSHFLELVRGEESTS
jgi:hypothetical protein